MESSIIIERLINNLNIFKSLIVGVNSDHCTWKPQPEKWSILEVLHHLYDEEREDFKLRIQYTLEDPEKAWIPINPQQWVIDRKYNEQKLEEVTNMLFKEREKSISWLKSLESVNWSNIHNHPKIGSISAGDLLSSWVAHDFLHIRQIINIKIEYYKIKSLPFNTKYAMP